MWHTSTVFFPSLSRVVTNVHVTFLSILHVPIKEKTFVIFLSIDFAQIDRRVSPHFKAQFLPFKLCIIIDSVLNITPFCVDR